MINEKRGFGEHYTAWRQKRINKLIKILGQDWFKGKKILELACGLGDIGLYFIGMGADVTFTDGDIKNVKIVKQRTSAKVLLLDNDTNWTINKHFDLIIHWGLLYHLDNWKRDLAICVKQCDYLCLESEVLATRMPTAELKFNEGWIGGAIHGRGSRPSATMIEMYLLSLNCSYNRYDEQELNSDYHKYDWTVNETDLYYKYGMERFWMVKTNEI